MPPRVAAHLLEFLKETHSSANARAMGEVRETQGEAHVTLKKAAELAELALKFSSVAVMVNPKLAPVSKDCCAQLIMRRTEKRPMSRF